MRCLKQNSWAYCLVNAAWTKGDLSIIRSWHPFGIFTYPIHCRKVLEKMQSPFCSHCLIFQQMDILGHIDKMGINSWWPKSCLSHGVNLLMHTQLEPAQTGRQGRRKVQMCWSSNREDVKEDIPFSLAAVQRKNFAFSLLFNPALWEIQSCKTRWPPASEFAQQLLQAKQEADWGHTRGQMD